MAESALNKLRSKARDMGKVKKAGEIAIGTYKSHVCLYCRVPNDRCDVAD